MKVFKIITLPVKFILIIPIYFYKFIISPLLPKVCVFYPTCSSYGVQAILSYGFFKGGYLTARRILKCNGFNKGGLDYIPDNVKGEFKWLI